LSTAQTVGSRFKIDILNKIQSTNSSRLEVSKLDDFILNFLEFICQQLEEDNFEVEKDTNLRLNGSRFNASIFFGCGCF
jgi:hypothetical protein